MGAQAQEALLRACKYKDMVAMADTPVRFIQTQTLGQRYQVKGLFVYVRARMHRLSVDFQVLVVAQGRISISDIDTDFSR